MWSVLFECWPERLHEDLQNKNVRCWFAQHDVQGGKKRHEQIDEAAQVLEKVLPILSEHGMSSDWKKRGKYKKASEKLLGDLKAGRRSGL